MAYWLVKSDPETYGFDDLIRDKKTDWTGVRNYAARIHLNSMAKGDAVLVYHSNSDKAVVGSCVVSKAAFPDETATEGQWVAVELKSPKYLKKAVTLADMKLRPELQNIGLIKIGRLSVMPLSPEEYSLIMHMAGERVEGSELA